MLIPAAALVLGSLAGCSASVSSTPTAPATAVASVAEDALAQQVGSRPSIDCGSDDVKIVEGTVVKCTLTDPANGQQLGATVTITTVNDGKYTVDVQVASQ
jgi:hypothetical protein